jgi:hypothetical protein
MLARVSTILHSFLLIIFIGSFSSIVYYIRNEPGETDAATYIAKAVPTAAPAAVFTRIPAPSIPPTLQTVPDAGWSLIQPGLERRVIDIYNDQNQPVESLHIWRLDQRSFRLDVAYAERPKSLATWQEEMDAVIVLNGGYYSIENERYFPDGLTVVDGKASGRSFNGFGGMLAIHPSRAELRWLVEQPYDPSEKFQAALQSFPILVKPGGQLGFGPERENHVQARRTVIAQDHAGRILLMVAPQGYFTLHQLSVYLTESDLDLDIAVNLDGGGSTGILVANPRELIPPTRPIPFVILVHPR